MTAAMSRRSRGTCASRSTIDAMVRTSKRDKFARLARPMFTLAKFARNAVSCSSTSSCAVALRLGSS